MKKITTLLVTILLTASIWAQSPQKMSYQAVIRDASNTLVTNTAIGMRISILQTTSTGTAVYIETQTPTTNANGLVSIEIGTGSVISGTFNTIDWSTGPYFIKTETDLGGGINYTITGTSQLLSVPYALYAKTAESTTETDPVFNASASKNITTTDITNWNNKYDKIVSVTRTELDALTPVLGQIVYDSTDGVSLMWSGAKWYKLAGNSDCFPQPTAANAGSSQTITTTATSTTLSANTPTEGIGTWSIISGSGGSFSDIHNPTATFSGNACTTYQLTWSIGTNCGSINQNINISFSEIPTTANAGSDIYSPLQTTVNLNGNTPSVGTGTWSVVSGLGGSFSNANSPNSSFTGNDNTKYTLRWTTTSSCGNTSFDEVNIYLGIVVGQFWGGGIVFYVDGTGQHGLICALNDQSSGATWGCDGTLVTGANGFIIGTGAQNTIDIEAGCTTPGTAADLCANLIFNGQTDWFLPSENELNEMALSKDEIAITAIANSGSGLITIDNSTFYWSSSQGSSTSARVVNITFNTSNNKSKLNAYYVRAVRSF